MSGPNRTPPPTRRRYHCRPQRPAATASNVPNEAAMRARRAVVRVQPVGVEQARVTRADQLFGRGRGPRRAAPHCRLKRMILADERYVRMASRSIFTAMSRVDERSTVMSQVYVSMAMSLDGFVTGPQDDAENPAGINGMRLMDWLGHRRGRGGRGLPAHRPQQPDRRRRDAGHWSGHHRQADGGLRRLLGWRPPQRRADLRPHPSATG